MKFEKGFFLGAATAAHQVEGNNIYSDYWVQENLEHSMFDEPSGLAVDHYNRYEEDIRLLSEAGLNAYRFSIEWARIQPEEAKWDETEVEHYKDVIQCCLKYGVEPVITLMHFTSPKWLIRKGGWENPEVVEDFAAYCGRIVSELGDGFHYVCTINEANMRLQLAGLMKSMMARMMAKKNDEKSKDDAKVQVGINMDQNRMMQSAMETAQAFGFQDPRKVATFVSQCSDEGDRIVMRAHMAAVKAIRAARPDLKVGITLSLHDLQKYSDATGQKATEDSKAQEEIERIWDEEILHYLPALENDDFLGVQCYTRKCINDQGQEQLPEGVKTTQMGYENYPESIGHVVRKVAESFKGELIVTENGIATSDDEERIEYIKTATESIKSCIDDGLPVKGYFYWSLLDNFEWQKGFKMTFGLIGVDRSNMERHPKGSLNYLGSLR